MNFAFISGYVSKDVELKATKSGKSVVSFSVGVKRQFSPDETDFFEVVAWDKSAEYVGKYAKKGSFVEVAGRIRPRAYESKNGNKVTVYEIHADDLKIINKGPLENRADSVPEGALDDFDEILSDDGVPF